jgi:hypothetical protein
MKNKFTTTKIKIKDLDLWDENARFPDKYFQKPEEELISYFISNKDFKIIDLALKIVEEFYIPQVEKLIIYNFNGKNIVLEGNRRLTVYKVLSNPSLIKNNTYKNKFDELSKKIKINDNYELECVVTEDIDEGYRLIERKHLHKNNEVSWGDNERAHHNLRRGKANQSEKLKVEISKIIKKLDIPEILKENILGPGYVTTFWRIIDSSSSYKKFGFNFSDDLLKISDDNFDDKLKVIITDIISKDKFNGKVFSRLNKEDINNYLNTLNSKRIDTANKILKESQKNNLFGEVNTVISQKNNKIFNKTTSRDYLIPKTCRITINQSKINNIYRELRDDLLLDDSNKSVPNATGVLFRVFLEVSLDYYAEKDSAHFFGKDTTINQKIEWVVNNLTKKGHDNKLFDNIRKVGSSSKNQSYLSIENFHDYVHSSTIQPCSNELKTKWDNLEGFFTILWDEIIKKEYKKNKKK